MATDTPMQLGMVGLGRMGANLVRRLMRDGHQCVVYDVNPDAVTSLQAEEQRGPAHWLTSWASWTRPARCG
jgi:6-phosphogluconate dehydrogenase